MSDGGGGFLATVGPHNDGEGTGAGNGLNFILAATLVWGLITLLWAMPYPLRQKVLFTYFAPMPLLPLAFGLSKLLHTEWTIPDNPLSPLGLWLNFAQLFYFPILIYAAIRHPDDFIMVYAVITGAHFFPYAWFYRTRSYAVMAGLIAVGVVIIRLNVPPDKLFWIPAFVTGALLALAVWLLADYRANKAVFDGLPPERKQTTV